MANFYVLPEDVTAESVRFRADEAKHLYSVLRRGSGDVVTAVDGLGNEYSVVLDRVSPAGATGRIVRQSRRTREPILRITLAQALTKGTKMDMVIQKGTELGVMRFVPMITQRTVIAADQASLEKKRRRWKKIAIGAMKQSLRSQLPEVESTLAWADVLREVSRVELALMASLVKDAHGLSQILSSVGTIRKVMLLVGPEGGFSAEEIQQATAADVRLVSLGPRRLRAETAAIILVGLVLSEMGEIP